MRNDKGESTFWQWFKEGTLSLPLPLLQHYRSVGMSDQEMMLMIHLMAFQQVEKNEFPSLDDLVQRLSCDRQEAMQRIHQLVEKGLLSIVVETPLPPEPRSERYDLSPFFRRCFDTYANIASTQAEDGVKENLFLLFEQQFSRPLTPMEYEMLSTWLDMDGYTEELIVTAMKEAVFSGKLSFRYIDRILLEWQRQNITTPKEAKRYAQRFHAHAEQLAQGDGKAVPVIPSITFYNWLEAKEEK